MRWFLVLVVGMAVACSVPGSLTKSSPTEVPIPPGQGQLVLHWQSESRALLGSSWASSMADAYELILQGASGTRSVMLDLGSGQAVGVDPGVYRVTILAGVKRSSGSSTAYLVGSSTVETVTVTLGQRTQVDFLLKSTDIALSTPGAGYWKGTLTVATAGKTRNPRVGMQLAGPSTTNRPRFKSVDLWNGYKEMVTISGTPDDWSAEASGTVPGSGSTIVVQLVGAGLCLQALDNTWVPTAGLTGYTWTWPNRADLADTHPLVPATELAVAIGPPPTGVTVGLAWE